MKPIEEIVIIKPSADAMIEAANKLAARVHEGEGFRLIATDLAEHCRLMAAWNISDIAYVEKMVGASNTLLAALQ